MLYVDSGELQLLMEPDIVSGEGPAISVATAADGRRYLQVENEDADKLHRISAVLWSRQRDGLKVSPDVERTDSSRLMNVAIAGQRRARRNRPL